MKLTKEQKLEARNNCHFYVHGYCVQTIRNKTFCHCLAFYQQQLKVFKRNKTTEKMKTTLTKQIEAIQKARVILKAYSLITPTGDIDQGLNDAGSTIASINLTNQPQENELRTETHQRPESGA